MIRSFLFQIFFWIFSVASALAMVPLFLAPRRAMIWAIRTWASGVLFGLKMIAGVRFEVRGQNHFPSGAVVVASKHQASIDVFALFTVLPDACFVMKKELLAVPLFGWIGVKAGMIVVDRDGHATALKRLVTDARSRMTEDRQLVIFPEGTRREPGAVGDYKPGVAALYRELALPVTPMALNSGQHWPAKGWQLTPGTLVFEFLPPIPAGLKRGEFMRSLEDRIEGATANLLMQRL